MVHICYKLLDRSGNYYEQDFNFHIETIINKILTFLSTNGRKLAKVSSKKICTVNKYFVLKAGIWIRQVGTIAGKIFKKDTSYIDHMAKSAQKVSY